MAKSDPFTTYNMLTRIHREMLQLFAINAEPISRTDAGKLLKELGCVDDSGQSMLQTFVSQELTGLEQSGFLTRGAYNTLVINHQILDIAVQDAIRCGVFTNFSNKL